MKHLFSKILLSFGLLTGLIFFGNVQEAFAAANSSDYDTTRIYHAMAKARSGEPVTIGVIGGSITEGYAAGTEDNRWANLVADWWETTFPSSEVTLINAGIGGTGSDIGVHRMQNDILDQECDFIVVEFAVNDTEDDLDPVKMMEGLVQQALTDENLPGIMMILLKMQDGGTAQADHKTVGNHYKVPMVSFVDQIDTAAANDGYTLDDVYLDGVHPVDLGMAYIAEFINRELDIIYSNLPADEDLPDIPTSLPTPIVGDTYSNCFMYTPEYIVPTSNIGWTVNQGVWVGSQPGDTISFTVDGNAISVMYNRHNNKDWGQIEAWVDDGPKKTIDAYWTETWGPAIKMTIIEEGLADGEHVLHIRVKEEKTSSGDGHTFRLLNVLKAGNFEGIAPMAVAGDNVKNVVGNPITLDGSASFDPMGTPLESYAWELVTAPEGSSTSVTNPTEEIAEFTPDVAGVYKAGLVVNNGLYNSVQSLKHINVVATNSIPNAVAGDDITIGLSTSVFLDGSGSSDPEGDPLFYQWRIVSESPEGGLGLYNTDKVESRLYASEEGTYTVGLVVNDSIADSEESTLVVTALEGYTFIAPEKQTGVSVSVYPNPGNDLVTVNYSTNKALEIEVAIYSLSGQKLVSIHKGMLTAGNHSQNITLSDYALTPGIYLIRIINAEQTQTQKFIKQ